MELTEYSDNNHGTGHIPSRDKQTLDKQIFSDVGTGENGKKSKTFAVAEVGRWFQCQIKALFRSKSGLKTLLLSHSKIYFFFYLYPFLSILKPKREILLVPFNLKGLFSILT